MARTNEASVGRVIEGKRSNAGNLGVHKHSRYPSEGQSGMSGGDPQTIADLESNNDDAVVIANDMGLISFVNRPFEKLMGWSREEIVGQPLTVIIPKVYRIAFDMGFSRFQATGKSAMLVGRWRQLRSLNKNGLELETKHFIIIAENRNGEWIFGSVIRPIGTG